MKEIIEISFEEVDLSKMVVLLAEIYSKSNLLNYQTATENRVIIANFQAVNELSDIFITSSNGSFYFNFSDFKSGDLELPEAGIQVFKNENGYDFNIDIEYKFLKHVDSIETIQQWAGAIANTLRAKTYFCGYEPAYNSETRFFSGNILGPLKFNS